MDFFYHEGSLRFTLRHSKVKFNYFQYSSVNIEYCKTSLYLIYEHHYSYRCDIGIYFHWSIPGFILSFFFIVKSSSNIRANRYHGLLLLSLTLCILEQFLNITGYITKVLVITNSTEPLNLVIGPLLYLFVKSSLDQNNSKKDWIHFILAIIYLCYLMFDLTQSNEAKYNSYIYSFHPDWPYLKVHMKISNDPLDLKKWLNLATGIQLSVYTAMAFRLLVKRVRQAGESIFRTNDEILRSLRNMVFHIAIVVLIFTIVKLCFKALDNLASLSELAKKIGESSHHVSQVMNEKLNKSFFELLASYRIDEAKKILSGDKKGKITVEEVSEMVGYNSKTAFNNAFKKLSGKTPSEFRKSVNI